MRKLFVAVVLIVVMSSAQAQEILPQGYHSPSQFERSTALCNLFALKHMNVNVRMDPVIKRDFFDNCMISQGFAKDK